MTVTDVGLVEAAVHLALASVDDPEYPGVSIVDLGLVESVAVDADGAAHIGLIPTFSGCPALVMIANEVRDAVERAEGVRVAEVEWLPLPVWTPERITDLGRARLAQEFTVAVQLKGRIVRCPRCGGRAVEESLFGPTRCRSIHVCQGCGDRVEVVR